MQSPAQCTRSRPHLGVVYRPDFRPESLPGIAWAVEDAGVDELWLWEDCFLQGGIAQAAVALASTERLTVGLGVAPAPLRSVVAMALDIATLARIYPGRLRVGIGNGVQTWMRQSGVKVGSPLTLLREYVTALRHLLAGETVTCDGRYAQLSSVSLDWVPQQRLPIFVGGSGPKTLRLASEVGDGLILDCQNTVDTVRATLVDSVGGRSADAASTFDRVMYVACAPGANAHDRLLDEAIRWNVPDPNAFGVGGSAAEIRNGIGEYVSLGIDTIVLQPIGDEATFESFLSAVAATADLSQDTSCS